MPISFILKWVPGGLKLWAEEGQDRDFFLLMPDASRHTTRRIVVEYADAMAMTKALLLQLKMVRIPHASTINKESLIFAREATSFWSEHSHPFDVGKLGDMLGEVPIGLVQPPWQVGNKQSGGLHQDSPCWSSHDAVCGRAALQRFTPAAQRLRRAGAVLRVEDILDRPWGWSRGH